MLGACGVGASGSTIASTNVPFNSDVSFDSRKNVGSLRVSVYQVRFIVIIVCF